MTLIRQALIFLSIILNFLILLAYNQPPTISLSPPISQSPTSQPSHPLILPVLVGTPVPLPKEPITPNNVDQIQLLAMWGRGIPKHAAFSPDGQTLAIGTTAGVWLHDAKTLELRRFILTDEEVMIMTFLADGQLMVQVGGWTIQRWDVTTGTLVGSWQIEVDLLLAVAFAPDGARFASALNGGAQVGIWELPGGRLLKVLANQTGPQRWASALAFSPDGNMLASAMPLSSSLPPTDPTLGNAVEVWNVKTGALIHTLSLPDQEEMSNIVFSADDKLLAAASGKDIFIWQVETGVLLHTLKGHTAIVARGGGLSFSADGQQLISVGFDQTIRLWGVEDGDLRQTLTDPELLMLYLAFSADGAYLT